MRRATLAALAAILATAPPAAAQDAPSTSGKPVVGGGSFNTAPVLSPGRYADTVAAGETVYYRVKLAKGQVLSVDTTVDTSELETEFGAPGYQEGLVQLDYRTQIYTPLREELAEEGGVEFSEASVELEGDDEAGIKQGTAKSSRVLGYEQILASDYSASKYPAPGEWFVSVSAYDDDIYPAEVPAEFPLELDVRVEGTPQPSSADFAKSLPGPAPDAPAPQDGPAGPLEATQAAATEPSDPALTLGLVGAIALVGGLGLGALAALVLRPGRRAAT